MIGVLLYVAGVVCIVLLLHFVRGRSSQSWQPIVPLQMGIASEDSAGRTFEDRGQSPTSAGQPDRTEEAAPATEFAAKCH
ncbi:MAG: hypothetical protein A3H94_08550 [Acidobacteria bacterium RIFCSPLOWO2_02_FULL_60_20]|nr:MAG: hypothetical protein A3H94_08550 [Acidobacteria bacterium RIFCSPLOWO2_02_FULL_60_20]